LSSQSGRKPLLVYHKPGKPGEQEKIEKLRKLLAELGYGLDVATIEEALEAPEPGRRVFLLLFTRGGHWKSLVDTGYHVEHIPPHLAACVLAQEARRRRVKALLLVALRAHRLREEQLEDIEHITRLTAKLGGIRTRYTVLPSLSERAEAEPDEHVAPLALLNGRLVHAACPGTRRCLGPFIDYGAEAIAAWIIDRLASSRPQ
jgi:hypothetical protein